MQVLLKVSFFFEPQILIFHKKKIPTSSRVKEADQGFLRHTVLKIHQLISLRCLPENTVGT